MTAATPQSPAEIDLILESMPPAAAYPFRERGSDAPVRYLYREGSILVREQDIGTVQEVLNQIGLGAEAGEPPEIIYAGRRRRPGVIPVVQGVARLIWSRRDEESRVPTVLEQIDAELGVGVARPDHLLVVASHPCPATEPELPGQAGPFPGVATDFRCSGRGAVVSIVDTGLAPDATTHDWLADVTGDPDRLIADGAIQHFGGHGTFVAGCLRCIAPRASVRVEGSLTITVGDRSLTTTGAGFESDLAAQMVDALQRDPDVMVLTFATETREDLSLLGFDAAFESRLRHAKGLAFLAPAGNDSSASRQWPAAFDWVISVGALSADWRARADFSNYGRWVDVFAPGEDLVNALATGRYTYVVPPKTNTTQDFAGMARWSGTSFSTPIVAGLIAARMSATGESGRAAAESLLRLARSQFIPGVGAVLFPDQACCDAPSGTARRCCCHPQRRCTCGHH